MQLQFIKQYLVVVFIIFQFEAGYGQINAPLDQLSFMSGIWKGSMEWGELEEFWSSPQGDNMMGTFRCVKNDKVLFYEFIVIEQSESGVPTMRLRHFDRGSIAWEDKEKPYEYPLVYLDKSKAIFESPDKKTRLMYERINADQLKAILEREKNGKWEVDEFLYTEVKP